MSRWRPPAEKSTALITASGHARLKAELDDLWRVRRPEVVKALAAASALMSVDSAAGEIQKGLAKDSANIGISATLGSSQNSHARAPQDDEESLHETD